MLVPFGGHRGVSSLLSNLCVTLVMEVLRRIHIEDRFNSLVILIASKSTPVYVSLFNRYTKMIGEVLEFLTHFLLLRYGLPHLWILTVNGSFGVWFVPPLIKLALSQSPRSLALLHT